MAFVVSTMTSGTETTQDSISIALSAGSAVGNIWFLAYESQGTNGTPQNYAWTTLLQDNGSQAIRSKVFYRILDGSETSETITFDGSSSGSVALGFWVSGQATSSPIGASSMTTGGNSSSASGTAITPAAANSLFLFYTMNYNGRTTSAQAIATSNPTWTEAFDGGGGTTGSLAMAHAERAAATNTGAVTATFSAAPDSYNVGLIALSPQVIVGPANVKTWNGTNEQTGVKTYNGLALASTKTVNGLA